MKPNILIVEDEVLIAQLLKSYLESANYNCVGIAIDYEQAIGFLKTESVDLVLLDVSISGTKTGIQIANFINLHFATIPFMYLTSHSDEKTLNNLIKTNPVGYLSKPFKKIDIVTTLNLYFKNLKVDITQFKLTIGKSIYTINLEELLYVKSDHVYVKLFFKDEELLLRATLKTIIETLPKKALVRINKSVAVNPKFVSRVNTNSVELSNQEFKLSDNFRHNLLS